MIELRKYIGKHLESFSHRYLDIRLVFIIDILVSVFGSFSVFAMAGMVSGLPAFSGFRAFDWIGMSALSSALAFYLLKTYRIVIRHTTFKDSHKFAVALLIKVAVLFLFVVAIWHSLPRLGLILFLDFIFTLVCILGLRLVMVSVYDNYKARLLVNRKCSRILVYGLSDEAVSSVPRFNNSRFYEIVGFITPGVGKPGITAVDKRVYSFSNLEDLKQIVRISSISAILFPTESDVHLEKDRLLKFASQVDLKSYMIPDVGGIGEIPSGSMQLNEVRIEDILGRDEISISLSEVSSMLSGKTVMVTGAAGSIGSELCRQIAKMGVGKLIFFDNAETPMHNLRLEFDEKFKEVPHVPVIGDVRLKARLDFAFRKYRPQIVFHAAAYKHVPLMEENPCEAVLVNVAGSRNVADKCIEYDVEKMVMVSTDKAVNPTNIMGCTKRLAEMYVQSLGLSVAGGMTKGNTKFVTTRFGNVLGSNGSVIPRFREQLRKGGPITVTDPNITRFFMTIPEACSLVLEAATLPVENRIFVFDMGDPVKIDTLARRMIELSGLEPDKDIKIKYTGLRPGEKLYEEVLSDVENTDPTSHDKIRIAKVREFSYEDVLSYVDRLEELSRAVMIPEVVQFMKSVVPEFISNNSIYCQYDKK